MRPPVRFLSSFPAWARWRILRDRLPGSDQAFPGGVAGQHLGLKTGLHRPLAALGAFCQVWRAPCRIPVGEYTGIAAASRVCLLDAATKTYLRSFGAA